MSLENSLRVAKSSQPIPPPLLPSMDPLQVALAALLNPSVAGSGANPLPPAVLRTLRAAQLLQQQQVREEGKHIRTHTNAHQR